MSFSRAFFPVVVIVLTALVAIILSLGATNRAIKETGHKLSYHSMSQHLKNIQDFQETLLLDYSEWNSAFHKMTIENNMAWFRRSIGNADLLNSTIHGMAFIKNDGTLVEQFSRKNNRAFAISLDTFKQDFHFIRQKVLEKNSLKPVPLSFFKNINGTPALISFSPLTHPNLKIYPDFSLDQRDFLIFWTVLTPELLSQVSENLKLSDLSVTDEQSDDNFALRDSKGNIISRLKWSLPKEETNPLSLSLYTSLAMFALLLLGGYFSHRKIFDLIRQLDHARKQAEAGHRIKSEFLATMSHELRTPLNSIIGFSDILVSGANGPLNASQREYIEHIQASGEHLLNIINGILDMSKIEAGKYDLREEEMDLKRVIQKCLIYIKKAAKDKNITLVKKIPKEINEFMGDEKVIKQLLLNLLSNAIKFTPEKGKITVGCSITQDGRLEIFVKDNGIGISAEKLDIITEPYLQDQDHKTRSHQGTGLGLAISKAFVELHQGTMDIKSELNAGTLVTISFPASRVLREMT